MVPEQEHCASVWISVHAPIEAWSTQNGKPAEAGVARSVYGLEPDTWLTETLDTFAEQEPLQVTLLVLTEFDVTLLLTGSTVILVCGTVQSLRAGNVDRHPTSCHPNTPGGSSS
jgi:hypothetical protein